MTDNKSHHQNQTYRRFTPNPLKGVKHFIKFYFINPHRQVPFSGFRGELVVINEE
jgi:hypothetical protein